MQQFPVRPDRVKAMRLALVPPAIFAALFLCVVVLAYDFEGPAQGSVEEQAIFYGSIVGVFAVAALLAGNTWRKIPRRFDGDGLVIAPGGISIDYGNGPARIDLSGVTGVIAVAAKEGELPEAVVFCKGPDGDHGPRDRNRVIHKVRRHIARTHRFRQQDVLPIAQLGEERAPEIVAALRPRLTR